MLIDKVWYLYQDIMVMIYMFVWIIIVVALRYYCLITIDGIFFMVIGIGRLGLIFFNIMSGKLMLGGVFIVGVSFISLVIVTYYCFCLFQYFYCRLTFVGIFFLKAIFYLITIHIFLLLNYYFSSHPTVEYTIYH